jgi:hypothetical protein
MLLSLLLLRPEELKRFVGDAPVITDDHPYTEFPLWRMLYDKMYQSQVVVIQQPGGRPQLGILSEEQMQSNR